MTKHSCVYLLGAGASYASPAPEVRIPMQRGFFAHIAASGFPPLGIVLDLFMQPPIREWLIASGYGTPNDPSARLRNDQNLYLEDFYSEIENDGHVSDNVRVKIIHILDQIVFEAISVPVTALRNHPERTCPYHRALIEHLKPGDTIVSFNYDCLIDDALLYYCDYWHPLTGYGFRFDDVLGGTVSGKAKTFQSRVLLLKPHGSATFRYKDSPETGGTLIRYLGLVSGIQPLPMRMAEGWDPLIVPPSTSKRGHQQFMQALLSQAQRKIQGAKRLVVIGYSFPLSDFHIAKIFHGFDGELVIANPEWGSDEYNERLQNVGLSLHIGYPTFEKFLQANM